MKKKYIVKNNREFSTIMNEGKKYQTELFSLYINYNNLSYNRYGISISKKIGNAVIRNKYRRQIKQIIDSFDIKFDNLDVIIIGRIRLKEKRYEDVKENIIKAMNLIGEIYEKK